MAKTPGILDRWGRPIRREAMTEEFSAATIGGVRSPLTSYPGDGLNPIRLAQILREADHGDPVRYLELAETVEERDPHYLGVLGTRRRAVSQIDITVEAASDDQADVRIADMVRDWVGRDELSDEMFDILDCIGKGFSFTEIIWDTSEGQWQPARLEYRDPRWFRFDRRDLTTPLRLDDSGRELPLEPGKYINARIRAKSGVPLRSGLARLALWGWMFKAFTLRDWAIFVQTYGQPLRLGKWSAGASEKDKDTLFRAVANIAGDCAAIIPESMSIEFIDTGQVSASGDLYLSRADWLDRQISKAVLGQTATTDAIAGGHAVGREHRLVQEDIETSDARAISAVLNRDLIHPWVQLEFGPQKRYPRLLIARPKAEDLAGLTSALDKLVPLGLRVEQSVIRDKLGLPEPAPGAEILSVSAPQVSPPGPGSIFERFSGDFEGGAARPAPATALNAERPSAARTEPPAPEAILADRMGAEVQPEMGRMLETIEAMLTAAGSLEEFREMLLAAFPTLDSGGLAARLAQGMMAAHLAGRIALNEESDG
ncbi:DUF935 domain-containing protein [Halodurantibacterium flavum]|uniref:DUF935 domain-containing protein n=1 Tax=Halodurantibacterium flavum TaxID=1382802 RepID=A0ABW4S954_9RHOB